ncbi:aldehyde dehydrogenase family protein [Rhizobacter sp. J219]|uniref:aldehyde dehydrogenase family protein n=1 Tax=Rhizobacter sp. J219 TaxID=2898430 RepID=UPI002151828A|nr:aldehyde dehydrogenase family protein [Rhizobacter sp. J219]MCR5885658.1 aldehyde dehydrogenase family protein [Rhizobacter sp. J219]
MKRNLVGGEWVAGDGHENRNPSDISDVVGIYAHADVQTTEAAIVAAQRAQGDWAHATVQRRFDALDFIGSELLRRKDELGALLSREEGKTLPEGIAEVARAGYIFKFHAHQAIAPQGELASSVRPGIQVEVTREPVGVIGIIAPWNFPMAIPAWKIAPALAHGNSVVFKPAEAVPGCAWALAEIISRSGLPAGVFNLAMGSGTVVGQTLLNDSRVSAISFTGSATTGRNVARAAAHRMVPVQLEMGGKNPMVVLDDADLELAVECAIQSAFYSTGQRCTAASRIIVTRGVYARFRDRLVDRARELRVGHALAADTQIGPVVDARQLDQDLRYIDIGKSEGASLACGGERLVKDTDGYFFSPAVFVDCNNRMRIAREEIFGPIAALIPAADYEEALSIANDTPFGLSSGICTTSLRHAKHFQRHAQAGMVMVNAPTAGVDYHVPFGGTKGSSLGGREQGTLAKDFYTKVKTTYVCA